MAADAVACLKRKLMPLCSLVTPNLPELALLSGVSLTTNEGEIIHHARELAEAGGPALLVKGGHADGDRSADLLVRIGRQPLPFEAPRLDVQMRGTGCMLASAIAARLGLGDDLETAVARGKDHVFDKLSRARR